MSTRNGRIKFAIRLGRKHIHETDESIDDCLTRLVGIQHRLARIRENLRQISNGLDNIDIQVKE